MGYERIDALRASILPPYGYLYATTAPYLPPRGYYPP